MYYILRVWFQVHNLEPRWGTCGKKLLKYFDSYSVSKCVSECETDIVEAACHCRDLQMPQKQGTCSNIKALCILM